MSVLDDDALLEGVPDSMADDAADAALLAGVDEDDDDDADREVSHRRQKSEVTDGEVEVIAGGEVMADREDAAPPADEAEQAAAAARKSGKRRIIEHSFTPGMIVGVDPLAAHELAKREARAAKFGVEVKMPEGLPAGDVSAPVLLTADEIAAREARAKKWGVEPANPVDSVVSAAGSDAFWEARRDPAEDEFPRADAIYVFGTDRMSSDDILLFFAGEGEVAAPKHVECVHRASVPQCSVRGGVPCVQRAALCAGGPPRLP